MIYSKEELINKISLARDAYYNLSPIMSDAEYDIMQDELKKIDPNNIEVRKVGASVETNPFEKVKHKIPMGSLDKANNFEEIKSWINNLPNHDLFISHKIDGLSMELIYHDGILKQCISRGDGEIGDDVTHNVSKIPSLPPKIPIGGEIIIRGEVYLGKDKFNKFFAGKYANPRNTASAKVREKQSEECHHLDFQAYFIDGVDYGSMDELYIILKDLGFKTPLLDLVTNLDSILEVYESQKNKRETLPYDIDGLVVSINDTKVQESLGSVNNRPQGQIAWKFEALVGITKVQNVIWQTGNTGRIVPIALVEPVEIGGVIISRVSLHNLDMFKELHLFEGCRVLISRKNDVIPYCEKNLDL